MSITLENVDELIDRWQKECDDLSPYNTDSFDRVVEPQADTACQAICLLPVVLKQLKARLVEGAGQGRERSGQGEWEMWRSSREWWGI
jgi:hypothetical protein